MTVSVEEAARRVARAMLSHGCAQFGPPPAPNPIAAIIAAYTQASVWYDPSDLTTMWQDVDGTWPAVVGLPIARIDDKGNLGLHATQADEARRPVLQQADGRLFLEFGEGDFLTIPAGTPPPTTGCCAVVAWRCDWHTVGTIYQQRGDPPNANHRHPKIAVSDTDAVVVNFGNQAIQTLPTSAPIRRMHVAAATIESDNVQIRARLNGVLVGADSGTGFGDSGDSPTGQIGGNFTGRIYGIVHVQHAVSETDRSTLECILLGA